MARDTEPDRAGALDRLVPTLRCPATGSTLSLDGGALRSESGPTYSVVEGVPVLLRGESPTTGPLRRTGTRRSRVAALLRWQPPISRNLAADAHLRVLAELLERRAEEEGRPQRVLVVGGATVGPGLSRLLEHPSLEVVETDIALGPRTQVVCDVQNLPFADESFDAAVSQAVLEYVPDPYAAAAEIHRVLRPRGLVYSEIPFLQQMHGPYDFTRFTHLGHRRLYRCFDEIRSGVDGGPGMALAWAWRAFLVSCGGRSRVARLAAFRVAALTAFWLPWLDGVLARQPGGVDAASSTFFLGEKRDSPVPDDEIIRGYRGAQPTLWE